MPRNWSAIAENSDMYEEQDFKSAGYQLMSAQVLYEREQSQRLAYHLIARYRNEYKELFHCFGLDLVFDDAARYVAAIPDQGNRRTILPLRETQLVLVLRKLYHEQASRGALEDGAIAIVTIDELRSAFQSATQRELPTSGRDITALIDQMQRFGIAQTVKCEDESVQPFDIEILPGIQTLVNEAALMKLAGHYTAAASLVAVKNAGKNEAAPTDEDESSQAPDREETGQ
jgi:Domain of unknown function (DUF4194)